MAIVLFALLSFAKHQIASGEKVVAFLQGQLEPGCFHLCSVFLGFFFGLFIFHTQSVSLNVFLDLLPGCLHSVIKICHVIKERGQWSEF